jgi:hypothetical protein
MLEQIIRFLYHMLAIYGLFCLIVGAFGYMYKRVSFKGCKLQVVLLVKDAERCIEGIIRNIFMGDFLRKLMLDGRLTVIDMGSEDKTRDILYRLKDEYSSMEIVEEDGKERVLDDFSLQEF